MVELLIASPLLTLFLTAALGTLLGAVPFGPVKFGAAGALFVGLAIGALDPELGTGLELVQSIGLALFVYTVGLASGATFFHELRRQAPLIVGGVVLIALFAALAIAADQVFDIGAGLTAGMMAGALTSTPALAAATTAAGGSAEPAVGYAIAYPVGVIVTMILVTFVARGSLPGKKDPNPSNTASLEAWTVSVEHPMRVSEIPGIAEIPGRDAGEVRVSYLRREGKVSVASPTEQLRKGDRVVVVGIPDAVARAQTALGSRIEENLLHDRSVIDFRHFIVSDPNLVGRTVAELLIPLRFDGKITRIRRGDHELLPTAEMTLQPGDRVLLAAPRERFDDIARFFGDSEKRITEVDFFSLGLGIALGVALGLITIPLGGGLGIALGSAAGPLLVGLLLGRTERTGPIVWSMPLAANLTIRQLGLVLFLASVGLSTGQAFAQTAFTLTGLTIAVTAAVLLTIILLLLWWWNRVTGMSAPRAAGAIAGFVGQPAILNHVNTIVDDARTTSGYAALFALGIIAKIVLVQAVAVLSP